MICPLAFLGTQDVEQLLDFRENLLVVRDQLVLFERSETVERHLQDGLRLVVGQVIETTFSSRPNSRADDPRADRRRRRSSPKAP